MINKNDIHSDDVD